MQPQHTATTLTLALLAALDLGCSSAPHAPNRDLDANACDQVISGASPTKLVSGEQMPFVGRIGFNQGQVYFATSDGFTVRGGVWSMAPDGSGAGLVRNVNTDLFDVSAHGFFYTEQPAAGSSGSGCVYTNDHRCIGTLPLGRGMVIDSVDGSIWGVNYEGIIAHAGTKEVDGFDKTENWQGVLAANSSGVFGFSRIDDHGSIYGDLLMKRRDNTTKSRSILHYDGTSPSAIVADDSLVVFAFGNQLVAIAGDGDTRTIRTLATDTGIDQLAMDASHIYYTARRDVGTEIIRIGRDGTASQSLTQTRCTPYTINVDSGTLYWTTGLIDTTHKTIQGAVWSMPTQ